MKWTVMYLIGYVIVICGVLAAFWKLGLLATIGAIWTLIGVAILIGVGIMMAVAYGGKKHNIEIDNK